MQKGNTRNGPQCLVVLGSEVGGRWGGRLSSRSRPRSRPPVARPSRSAQCRGGRLGSAQVDTDDEGVRVTSKAKSLCQPAQLAVDNTLVSLSMPVELPVGTSGSTAHARIRRANPELLRSQLGVLAL